MKNRLLFLAFLALVSLSTVSCSKDDDDNPGDPAGTVTLNMLNADNGKTVLGNSDVYIDNADNFHGSYCLLSSRGKINGLGNLSVPVLDGLSTRTAVESGNGYQIFKNAAIYEFPSGKLALNITADYYNVYVVSRINQGDATVGANVKFVLMDAPDYGLPDYNKFIGTLDHLDMDKMKLTISLPDSDFECEPAFAGPSYYTLEYEKSGNELIVRLADFRSSDVFGFYIRIKNSYTYVYGMVK